MQFTPYSSTPLLLLLQPTSGLIVSSSDVNAQALPLKAYEPTVEIRERKARSVFIEAPYKVETGEAERIAVDWTARGGGGGDSALSCVMHYTCRGSSFGILSTLSLSCRVLGFKVREKRVLQQF